MDGTKSEPVERFITTNPTTTTEEEITVDGTQKEKNKIIKDGTQKGNKQETNIMTNPLKINSNMTGLRQTIFMPTLSLK